ncbi:MAG: acyltransferase 3 [Amycolatopsis sp.]|uniref:acyltransferase family protein n=1 Tax=Amycolatopsis sp. TaxID=37632 RepID=UPI0026086856|nr:acyltransferase [Amycolatopsis sp.]MCU1682706.1 acyltransferase 3 [Amycolatopsis sp.]
MASRGRLDGGLDGPGPKQHADPNLGFAWLRMIGAITVVVDHSSPLVHPERLTIFPAAWHASPGYVALMGFFAMSGFQIQDSWLRDPSWWRFSARRLLRILPPLVFVLLVSVFVIGPVFTSWSAGDYWSGLQTWRYLVGNTVLFLTEHILPGVFFGNPYPWSVNGAIWTLPMEMVGYGIVLAVGVVIALGVSRWVLLPLFAALVVADGFMQATFGYQGNAGALAHVPTGSLVAFMVPFAIGVILRTFRDRIRFLPIPALILFAAWLVLHQTPLDRYLLAASASYGAIVLAHHWPKRLEGTDRWVVGSYGLYIWGFPVQQMIIYAGVRNQWLLMLCAVPAAYACGLFSWNFIEKPTQRLRRFLPTPKPAAKVLAEPRIEVRV